MKFFKQLKTKDIKFSDIMNSWLLYKSNTVKLSTYFKYKYVTTKYLYPQLNDKTLRQLLDYDFSAFINSFTELEKTTIKLTLTVLKSILKFAERKYNLDFKIDLIKLTVRSNCDLQVFSDIEKEKLIQYCYKNMNLKTIGILISLYTGIRIGELCALKWENIDLDKDIITINKTLQRIYIGNSTQILIDSPKSESSRRKIPINKKLQKILIILKELNTYDDNSYFLTGKTDKFIEPRNYQYTFKQILKELDLPNYNFHILRHTFATDCININMDAKSLSILLGHSSVNITLNKYVHPTFEKSKLFLEKI